jgi:phospho-N-acetylmuramoyl-pentapeptide-transferase
MIYHLVKYLSRFYDIPGEAMLLSVTFRTAMGIILALLIGMIIGRRIIEALRKRQIGEDIRELGLDGQMQKKGTPTMGGLIILASILVPVLLLGDLTNIYVQLMIVSALWLGAIGFLDDYIKVFRGHKDGLSGKFKIFGQVGLGVIVGTVMCARSNDLVTTIPFVKNNEFDYHWILGWLGCEWPTWVVYVLAAIVVITFVSNGANLTDGLDGLCTGVSAGVVAVLGILAYLGGSVVYADYLGIMYIPQSSEMVIFAGAFMGALIGFLWYNCHPAQVFMGDTGSLAIGGMIAVFALLIRKELLLPLLCGVFVVEGCSTLVQVWWFKYTKRRYGEGRRVLLMAPMHHHYQKKGYPETKIVVRFWIVQLLLAAITLVTLKMR